MSEVVGKREKKGKYKENSDDRPGYQELHGKYSEDKV